MDELIGGLVGVVAILVAIMVYVAVVIGYAIFVAPFVAAGTALFVAAALLERYAVAVRGITLVWPPARRTARFQVLPWHRPEDEVQPAYRQYFFGPALRDLRQIMILTWRLCQERAIVFGGWMTTTFITSPRYSGLVMVPVGLTLWIGLVAGTVLAAAILGALVCLHAMAVLIAQVLARAAIGLLRAADTALLAIKGIRGLLCPWCYVRISYPSYLCPGCRRVHTDIRPGEYGVLRRRCQCGERLPTLLLLGSYRLPAQCTNPICGRQMSDETGRFAEFVLPFFGGQSAGKTRLMAAMIMGLGDPGNEIGATICLADEETNHRYQVLREVLGIAGQTLGTHSALQRAHSMRISIGRSGRLVHMFDAAGERFADNERTDELRYLSAARVFVFVLDPMAVPQFWAQLRPAEKDQIDPTLASTMLPETVFHQSVQTMIQMGAKVRKARLAVAISKTDLTRQVDLLADRQDDSAWAERWLVQTLGQGNLVRAMRNEFREVGVFFTAAVAVGPDQIDESIGPIVTWCLRDERLRSRRRHLVAGAVAREPSGTRPDPSAAAAGSGRRRASR